MTDPDWVRKTALTLTDDGWSLAKVHADDLPEAGVRGIVATTAGFIPVSGAQARALLAYRNEVAAGLSPDQAGELATIIDGDGYCSLVDVAELLHVDLIRDLDPCGITLNYEVTSFGREIAHVLEADNG